MIQSLGVKTKQLASLALGKNTWHKFTPWFIRRRDLHLKLAHQAEHVISYTLCFAQIFTLVTWLLERNMCCACFL